MSERLDTAFDAWTDAQRAALETMRQAQGVPRSDVDQAEGYRWVTRLSTLALEWLVEKSDPLHPVLFTLQDEYRKLLVDNPDVHYLFCVLDDTRSYRLRGLRGGCAYLGMTFGTPFGQGEVGGRTGTQTQCHIDEFELGPNGEVDILIAPAAAMPSPPPRNAVVLEPGTAQLAIRETHFERTPDALSRLRMELVGQAEIPPPVLSSDELAGKLEFAAMFLGFVGQTAVQMWHDAGTNMNTFGGTAGSAHVAAQEDEVRTHSNAEMTYHGGRFALEPGQALVVTVHEPDQPFLYWGLTLTSPWMESYDYRYTTTALNNRTAQRSPDGSWQLVIAPTDPGPGVANWLDTGGRLEGYMLVRWVLADAPPHPSARLVSVADLTN
ncbi:MAG TPA: DUF1214 domain-containing protein [Acidimicrobiales bacterium]|jgi:hypothetical protein|nr:DUF1214 domain-containing protein [Acidimicrobiales bacterium]